MKERGRETFAKALSTCSLACRSPSVSPAVSCDNGGLKKGSAPVDPIFSFRRVVVRRGVAGVAVSCCTRC